MSTTEEANLPQQISRCDGDLVMMRAGMQRRLLRGVNLTILEKNSSLSKVIFGDQPVERCTNPMIMEQRGVCGARNVRCRLHFKEI